MATRRYGSLCIGLLVLLALILPIPLMGQIIQAGYDLSTTAYAYKLYDLDPIPADAFGLGSDPFIGRIEWTSGPMPDFQGYTFPAGKVDTVVHRPQNAVLAGPGSSVTIPVRMVALSFVSKKPIKVTFDRGTRSELWSVSATVSSNPSGTMTITQTSSEGGTFDSEFPVHPIFTFTRVSDGTQFTINMVEAGLPPNLVKQEDVPWRFQPLDPPPTPNHVVLRIPGLTTNFVPGYTPEEGRILMEGMAFRPTNPGGQARGAHGHFVSTSVH